MYGKEKCVFNRVDISMHAYKSIKTCPVCMLKIMRKERVYFP